MTMRPRYGRAPACNRGETTPDVYSVTLKVYPMLPLRIIDRIYPAPRPNDWYEEYERLCHLDLPRLNDDELWSERRCVQRRIDYGGKRDIWGEWMRARLHQLDTVIRQRQRQQRQDRVIGLQWGPCAGETDTGPASAADRGRSERDRTMGSRSAFQIGTLNLPGASRE